VCNFKLTELLDLGAVGMVAGYVTGVRSIAGVDELVHVAFIRLHRSEALGAGRDVLSHGIVYDRQTLTPLQCHIFGLDVSCAGEAEVWLPDLGFTGTGEDDLRVDMGFEFFEQRIRHVQETTRHL